eukprot:gene11499-11991_t
MLCWVGVGVGGADGTKAASKSKERELINAGSYISQVGGAFGDGSVANPWTDAVEQAIDYAEKVGRQGKAAYLYIPDGHFKSKHFKVPHNTLVIGNGIGSWVHVDWPKDARARTINWDPQSDMHPNSVVCSVVLAYDDVINGERWTLTTQDRCGHLTIEVAA